ncbi:MAG: MBL fold metallo-hydrolase [Myxococcales bacterium]|nr:MBL fold metallo-hydrolase [Myxococcales bacterium]
MQSTEDVYKKLQEQEPVSQPVAGTSPASVTLLWRRCSAGELELFLVRRATTMRFLPGFWAFPGGKQDAGDASARHAGVRELAEETGVVVSPNALEPVGRWITPIESPLRYDTQYFLVELPEEQNPDVSCSDGELIDSLWCRPADALDRFDHGTLLMSSPVVRMLSALLPGLDDALARAEQAARDEDASPRLWGLVGGIAVSPLRTPTLPPATRTNCYFVGTDELIIVDPASPHEDERGALCEAIDSRIAQGATLREIWLTHHHFDHVGAAQFVSERYGVPIAAHAITADLLRGQCEVEKHLADGEQRALSGRLPRLLECIFTPGHAPGHLCFYERSTETLFAGDMVASHGTILIDPSEGDMSAYLDSLERLRALKSRLLLPAHGFAVSDPDSILRRYISHRLSREAKVLAVLSNEPQTVFSLVEEVYADTPLTLHSLAERSLISHLVKLTSDGKARKDESESTHRWRRA